MSYQHLSLSLRGWKETCSRLKLMALHAQWIATGSCQNLGYLGDGTIGRVHHRAASPLFKVSIPIPCTLIPPINTIRFVVIPVASALLSTAAHLTRALRGKFTSPSKRDVAKARVRCRVRGCGEHDPVISRVKNGSNSIVPSHVTTRSTVRSRE